MTDNLSSFFKPGINTPISDKASIDMNNNSPGQQKNVSYLEVNRRLYGRKMSLPSDA
jgi:hypothetical protein